jgi:hypothetical protein
VVPSPKQLTGLTQRSTGVERIKICFDGSQRGHVMQSSLFPGLPITAFISLLGPILFPAWIIRAASVSWCSGGCCV